MSLGYDFTHIHTFVVMSGEAHVVTFAPQGGAGTAFEQQHRFQNEVEAALQFSNDFFDADGAQEQLRKYRLAAINDAIDVLNAARRELEKWAFPDRASEHSRRASKTP